MYGSNVSVSVWFDIVSIGDEEVSYILDISSFVAGSVVPMPTLSFTERPVETVVVEYPIETLSDEA